MKCVCQTSDLLTALSSAQKAVGSATTLPILEHVLLKAEGSTLTLIGNNLEMAIQATCEAEIGEEGGITVPARMMTSWVHLAPDSTIELSSNDSHELECRSGSAKTIFKGLNPSEYPPLPVIERVKALSLPSDQMLTALERTTFSTASGATRPLLSGVYCHAEGEGVVFVGTDSFRLSEQKMSLELPVADEVSAIIPSKTLQELERILSSLSQRESVDLVFSDHQVEISVGSTQILSRLIEGEFPNYEQILPKNSVYQATLSKKPLIQSLKRIMLFARYKQNRVECTFRDGALDISSPLTELGNEEFSFPLDSEGAGESCSLNAQYLLDILMVLPTDEVVVQLSGGFAPVLLRSESLPEYQHIIMPLRG